MKEKLIILKTFLKRNWLFIFLALIATLVACLSFIGKAKPPAPQKFLVLISVEPPEGKHETIWTSYPVRFNFDQPLEEKTLEYQIIPPRESFAKIENEGKTLAIYPKTGWIKEVTFQIKINNLESKNKEKIASPITYQFSIIPPKTYDVW